MNLAGRTAQDWPRRSEARDAARMLHERFDRSRPNQYLGKAAAPRMRLLVRRVVPVF
jgi:hypothetical protein